MLNSQRLERLETEEKGRPRAETLSYTAELPGVEGPVTVELNTQAVENSLMNLAQGLGYGQEEAKRIVKFFEENIEVGFGRADKPVFSGATPIDKATSWLIQRIAGGGKSILASVSPSENPGGRKGWRLTIDVERIAQAISIMKAGP